MYSMDLITNDVYYATKDDAILDAELFQMM